MNIKNLLLSAAIAVVPLVSMSMHAPTVWADIPDVAPLRVGDTYYMTSTTMHFNPGVPVMASKDLIDWKIISYCYETIEDRPEDRLENGKDDYMYGTWASSIRYNEEDKHFYVTSFNNRAKHTYLFRAKSPEGPWEKHVFRDRFIYDHSFWIEKGEFYFYGTAGGKVYLHHLKKDLSGFEGEPKLVCPSIVNCVPTRRGLAEGTQVFKRNGWYYMVNICWPAGHGRLVAVHRSRTFDGPFVEGRVAFDCQGIAQGSFIDRPDGSWVAVLFGDRGGVGRVPFIMPVKWENDWPVVQSDNAFKGDFTKLPACVDSDDFNSPNLKLVWQWNHHPDNANWSLTEKPGVMRIRPSKIEGNLLKVRNTLTQRTFGPTSVASVALDVAGMKVGDKAGLSLFQKNWGSLAVEREEGNRFTLVLDYPRLSIKDRHAGNANVQSYETLRRPLPAGTTRVYLKAVCDFTPWANPSFLKIPNHEDAGRFYFSLDGKKWEGVGEAMWLPYTIPHFTGYRFALFSMATKELGGYADFDDFRLRYAHDDEKLHMDGTNPIVKTRFTADPAALVDGDYFYIFTGHDDVSAHGYRMFDWTVVRTKDLKNWEDLGPVMSVRETFPWARPEGAWASQAIHHKGKWYWYVAVFDKKTRQSCVAVATADKPEGPWTDPLGKPLVIGNGFIDPSVFVDDDGKAWLFWGNCGGDPGCWYAELKPSMIELASEVKPVPGLMDEKAFGKPLIKKRGAGVRRPARENTNFEEAPWIYKLGDTYYLEYAAGGVPENWSYSTSKSIHGPWTYRGKIMDNAGGTGTIHGGSVYFKGQWLMLYHDGNLSGGGDCRRSVRLEPYTRNADGSIPFIRPTKEGVSFIDLSEADTISVNVQKNAKGHEVSKSLWGIFFEDINWAADGGLNPEMLANPGFDWQQADHEKWNCRDDGWEPDYRDGGMARLSFQMGAPVNPVTARHLRIEAFGQGWAGVRNRGLDGMWVKKDEPYRLSFDWREVSRTGIEWKLGAWTRETLEFEGKDLKAGEPMELFARNGVRMVIEAANDGRASFSILVNGRRTFEFDNVRLVPTGSNLVRAGLRKDLVDHLANLKPSFVRFPGGCIVEEGDFQHWYDWRRTVGPLEARECILNRWVRPNAPYWETFGVGFYEYFRLCEEIGAEPLPICLAGLTCQYQKPELACDVKDADYFAQAVLDLIEFANGDVATTWGKVRAQMGHPKPFNLKMVGVGNENWDGVFFDRYEPIVKIIREKHPEIKIVGSSGPAPDGKSFDYAWNRVTTESADLVDEHYYRSPEWFLNSLYRYDNYKREGKPKVYAGEYACHHRVGNRSVNTHWSAICEAVAMIGYERNSDVVSMASYAPLFAREGHDQWSPDLIWFNGTDSWLTPNYYVQQMFSTNVPDRELPIQLGDECHLFACAGVYEKTATTPQRYQVKLVNAADNERKVRLNLTGKATVQVLSGNKLDQNSREQMRIKPTQTIVPDFNGVVSLPAHSLVVVTVE